MSPSPKPASDRSVIEAIYADKPRSYFANARTDMVALLETTRASSILELGCGEGGTGRAALAAGKAGRYVGLELDAASAEIAARDLTEVVVGNVETMDLAPLATSFDALILSEVLEHLADPWTTVARLATCLKPGGMVLASSPNVSHWHVIRDLISGRFEYQEQGIMDRTHLRWFTPRSYRAMFEDAGVRVELLRPVRAPAGVPSLVNKLTGRRLEHLMMTQMIVLGRKA